MKCPKCKKDLIEYIGKDVIKNGYAKNKYRYCKNCNPYCSEDERYITHPGSMCRRYPERIKILYECKCRDRKKENHHFDYERIYEVIKIV